MVLETKVCYKNGRCPWILSTTRSSHTAFPVTAIPCLIIIALTTLNRKSAKKNEQTAPVVLHTHQGAVYSSRAYQLAHADYTIIRSMSRVATPTDNPIMEALNGWIKQELYLDFDLRHTDELNGTLNRFVAYFNHDRLAAALGYKSPVQFKIDQGFS